jgi:ankyrin repeat protein
MISRESLTTSENLARLGLIVFVLSALFGLKIYFFPDPGSGSKPSEMKGDLALAYATCVAENGLPGDYRSYSTLKPLGELDPKERAVVFGCAVNFQMLSMVRWVLADKSLAITVNPDFRGRWPIDSIASWQNGNEAIEALNLVLESENKNLFFSPFTAHEQSVAAAYNASTVNVARFLTEKWPDLLINESGRLSTLEKYSPDFSNLTLAQFHALKERFEIAQFFAERGSKVTKAHKSLRHEIFLKKRELLLDDRLNQFLLSQGVSIDERDEKNKTLLHYAVEQNDGKLVNHLLSLNAQTDVQDISGKTPLHYAVNKGSEALLSLLLTKSAPDTRNFLGRTPLQEAFSIGSWDAANLLLDKGARLDVRDTLGRTPIFDCVPHGCPALDRLISLGADINAIDKEGNSLLHLAAQSNTSNAELISKLIARGCSISLKNKAGRTPLHQIAEADDIGSASVLLENGSQPNQRDRMGNTPLHLAKSEGMISTLLEAGANPDLANTSGEIPLNMNIAHTQMLFHSPSHIKVKADTLIRYFSDIRVGEKQIELSSPMLGVFAINEDGGEAIDSRSIKLVARAPNQEYKVENTCQIIVKLIMNDDSLTLPPISVSDGTSLPPTEQQAGVFSLQNLSGNCELSNYSSAAIIEILSLKGKEEYAKWEAIAKQCDDTSTTTCQKLATPKLKVTVKKGENWKVAGVITAQHVQLNTDQQ